MIFHISYTFQPEHRDAAQSRFIKGGAPPPEGVNMLSRWHGVSGRKGIVVAESSELSRVASWMQQWTDLLTFQIEPVLDDEKFIEVLKRQ
ncbi:MAG: DUF3303 domain-containing protein [Aeoliella sp.]